MMRSMFAGVSGLRSHQTMMDVVGNNISNVNTTGFKSSATVFEDVLNQSVQGAGQGSADTGGTNPIAIGLGTDPDKSAKLQLDAKVDRYGSAKISGQISVRKPERLTEIDMSFRNLDMTSLSPYVAKFAGYKVAAGRLALDLQYRVKDSKLLGKNKIVLSKVALGEKVETPDAIDLPLELAIAILTDSKGVIDIGLPVR